MGEAAGLIILGFILVMIGASNIKGNLSSIHFYHRRRVSEEDRKPFGKMVGLGTIIAGCAAWVSACLSIISHSTGNAAFETAGKILLICGLAAGLGLSFYAMIRYNKGIF